MTRDTRAEMLLAGLIHDKILFIEVVTRFSGKIFEIDDYNNFFGYLKSFYSNFKKNPTRQEFEVFVDRKVLADFVFLNDVFYNPDISSDVLRKLLYGTYQKMQTLDFVEELEQKIEVGKLDIQDVFTSMKKVVLKTSQPDTSFLEIGADNAVEHYREARDYRIENTSPLVFKNITKIAAGGIADRELLIYVAPPSRGKTTYLINELYNGMIHGEKTLYLSMENEKSSVNSRLSNRILLMTKKEQRINSEFCENWIHKFYRYVTKPVIMYRKPNTYTVAEFDLWLEEYELKYGIKFNRIIVDYMNKFKQGKGGQGADYSHNDIRILADDLRAIAVARNTKILTAAQTNRSGIYNKEGDETSAVNESHIGGGFGQYETADIVLGYSETQAEKHKGVGRVGIMKMREESGRGLEFVVNNAPWIGLITDSPDEIVPSDKKSVLENPAKAFGELKGLDVRPPEDKKRKGGVPGAAKLSKKEDKISDEGVTI